MSCVLPYLCIVHFAQPIRKQLTRRCENKGFLVIWQHVLLLIKIWSLEFYNAHESIVDVDQWLTNFLILCFSTSLCLCLLYAFFLFEHFRWHLYLEKTQKDTAMFNFFKSSKNLKDNSLLVILPKHKPIPFFVTS